MHTISIPVIGPQESTAQESQRDHDPEERPEQQLPAADPLDEEEADEGAEEVDGGDAGADPDGLRVVRKARHVNDLGRVVHHGVDPGDLIGKVKGLQLRDLPESRLWTTPRWRDDQFH